MKIVCISDTHLKHDFKVPNGDILVHAGDLTSTGTMQQVIIAANWLIPFPHKYKVFVAGNHDTLFETNPKVAEAIFKAKNVHYLFENGITIKGIKFWGTPYQPTYNNRAFNLQRGSKELKAKFDKIPYDLDVLITHSPPYGILDISEVDNQHAGDEELLRVVLDRKPKVHIFGHIHGGYGQLQTEHTHFINAATCNGRYQPVNKPIVVMV
jgi:Icc-related predicted phosphoesterase